MSVISLFRGTLEIIDQLTNLFPKTKYIMQSLKIWKYKPLHSHTLPLFYLFIYFDCNLRYSLVCCIRSFLIFIWFFCLLELTTFITVVYVMYVFLFKHLTLFLSSSLSFTLHKLDDRKNPIWTNLSPDKFKN